MKGLSNYFLPGTKVRVPGHDAPSIGQEAPSSGSEDELADWPTELMEPYVGFVGVS